MKDIKAQILDNKKIALAYFKMVLEAPCIARLAKPGQFLQIRCNKDTDPLLRRPFSIHRLKAVGSRLKGIEVLYEVVGKGTEILSKKKEGDFVDILGPLGNGFSLPRASSLQHRALLIAGGIGVAPLLFLAEKLKGKIIVLIGAKTKDTILCEEDFKRLDAEMHIATDDGSRGYKGFVSELLEGFLLSAINYQLPAIYACGPRPMLKRIAQISKKYGLQGEASLEERMACGIGVCLGCAVKVKEKKRFVYKLACKDGPVFSLDEIIWK